MRLDNLRAFEKHLEGAAPRHLSPFYFVIGKDPLECQEAIRLLYRFLLPSDALKEYALSTFDGNEMCEGELDNALHTQSFLVNSRVILIRQAEKLKKPLQEMIQHSFRHPLSNLTLILTATAWAKNALFYKFAEKEGIILDLVEEKPWEKEKRLIEWVNKQAAEARKIISYQACQLLVKRVGTELALLRQELEKLICYCADCKEITLQDIERLCAYHHPDTVWKLGEAIFARNAPTALLIMQEIIEEGQPLLPLLRQMRSQFQTAYQVCLMIEHGKKESDITTLFPYMRGQVLTKQMEQARKYGSEAFKKGLIAIDAAELRFKGETIKEEIILELLLTHLTQK